MKQTKQKTFYENQGNPDDKAIEWLQRLSTVAEIFKFEMMMKEVQGEKRVTAKVRFRIF